MIQTDESLEVGSFQELQSRIQSTKEGLGQNEPDERLKQKMGDDKDGIPKRRVANSGNLFNFSMEAEGGTPHS